MTLYFNKKIVFCFFGVFLFAVGAVATSPEGGGTNTDTLSLLKGIVTINTQNNAIEKCEEKKEKLDKAYKLACSSYKKADCQIAIEQCGKIQNEQSSYYTDKKFGDDFQKDLDNIKTWQADIADLDPESEKLKIAALEKKIKKTGVYKYCPFAVAKNNNDYKKEKKENEKPIKDLKTERIDIGAAIEKIETKKSEAKSDRDSEILALKEKGAKNDRKYLKDLKNLDNDTKKKIKDLMDGVAKSRENIQAIDLKIQALLIKAADRAIQREEECHQDAQRALKEYKQARIRRVLNKTNRISFATLIKRSKLSKKDRDGLYKQKKQAECLNDPNKKKRLAFEEKRLLQIQTSLRKQQQDEVAKMKKASASQAKIDREEHINKGELIEANNKILAALSEEVGIKAKSFERKIQNFNAEIQRQVALSQDKAKDIAELDSSALAKEHLLFQNKENTIERKYIEDYTSVLDLGIERTEFYDDEKNECISEGERGLANSEQHTAK